MGNAKKESPKGGSSAAVHTKAKQPERKNERPRQDQTAPRSSFRKPGGRQNNWAKNQNSYKEKEKAARFEKLQKRNALRAQKTADEEAERERIQKEKEDRIRNYKKKRLEKTKAISKRTQRGQPLMKDRMQLLLKQIQEMKRA